MPKLLLVLLLMPLSLLSYAQLTDHMFRFTGQVLDPDSEPVEHAYLVNYRTLRAYATNKEGRFNIPVQTGDSLKLVHVSYESKILKVTDWDSTIFVEFEENMIATVNVKSVDMELQYFNKNRETIKLQLSMMMHYNYKNTKVQNPYNTNQFTGTTGIALSDIIDLFKKKK